MSVVEARVEAELDRWRTARAQQALIEGEWGAPPAVPVQGDGRVVLDPTGRFALLIGYRAVHLLDLRRARAQTLLDDARSGRDGAFSPDGRQVVVADGYGERLHWIILDDDPRVETWPWRCPRPMRGEHAVALDDAGRVAVVGRDIDEAPLHIQWIDGPTGAVKHTAKVVAEQHGAACAVADVRFAGPGGALQIRLSEPPHDALYIDPVDRRPRRAPAELGDPGAPWRLTTREGWQLVSKGSTSPIDVPRPRSAPCIGAGEGRLAVAIDGRVKVYGAGCAAPSTSPSPGRFVRVDQLVLVGDRLWLAGAGRSSPFTATEVPLLAGWRLEDDAWRPLGVVLLADREMAQRTRGAQRRRMSNVYVKGVQLSVAELEAKGITFVGDDDPAAAAAQTRFACPRDDPYGPEVPFARTPQGFFGRLDGDRPLGAALAEPFERPDVAAASLRGETPAFDAATAAALHDWRARLDFWQALPQVTAPDDLGRLMDASAGLGDLLPEIVHRAPRGKKGRPARPSALRRVAEKMQRRSATEREATVFREMLAREERRLRPELLRARLHETCPSVGDDIAATAIDALGAALEPLTDAAEARAPTLALTDIDAGAALIDLLVAARPDLHIDRLDLSGSAIGDAGLHRLLETPWPGLRALDLSRTAVTDRGAFALAQAAGFEALETLTLDGTAVGLSGRAAVRWSANLPALAADLSLLDGWLGLMAAGTEAGPACLTVLLDRLWTATLAEGGARERVECSEGPDATLSIRDVDTTPAALQALLEAPRTAGLSRLALRRCALDDDAAAALVRLRAALPPTAELDLSENRLRMAFAFRLALEGAPDGPRLILSGNPIEPAGWGTLRGMLGARLVGAPDDAVAQLRAMLRVETLPLEDRGTWLGRALAAGPERAADALAAVASDVDAGEHRALLTHVSAAATANPDPALWRALSAHALTLGGRRSVDWWLGDVGCGLTDGRLRLRPRRALSGGQLRVEAEPDSSRLRKLIDGQDVLTGDDDFDRVALITGEPSLALTVLDGEARAGLIPWLARGLTLVDGTVEAPAPADPVQIADLARLTAALALPDDTPAAALARRLSSERTPGTAVRLARALIAESPDIATLDVAAASPIEAARRPIGAALCAALDDDRIQQLGPAGCTAALEEAPGALRPALIARAHAIGDERAVAPLTRLADAFFGSGAIKKAARAAAEAIVERQGGLRAGGLTMVGGGPAGGLTVTDEP